MNFENVLLTGCAGFIGANTARMLLKQGIKVTGIDNLNDYYDVALKQYRLSILSEYPGFQFIKGDIEDSKLIDNTLKYNRPDAIINLAARAGVRASTENPYIYFSTNVTGTLNILTAMKDHGINKLVHASTSSVYSSHLPPFREDMNTSKPWSPYAASKLASEVLCHTWHHLYGFDVTIVRYFTVYGPAPRPDMSIFRFIRWIKNGQELMLTGDGTQSRDFTYVDDISRGTIAACNSPGTYRIINLGGGNEPTPMNYVIEIIEDLLGKKANVRHIPTPPEDVVSTRADISQAKQILNWESTVGIEDGLKRTVEWYLQTPDIAEKIKI
ncbi:SDR family NAD(P)-dependent oxidoreductase [Myxococcota bacterium]|nr:SDR family NAD(P)-dependent oxidoreductase [Myxococcota bacterium]MBU1381387.1 SDR family NAD(P)-dependent oxidoreductase [Myxococcota bacterium]MBU1498427.1 SDR family NAD(P)-dependent oxidoreductase [Myxococcota bacterium]